MIVAPVAVTTDVLTRPHDGEYTSARSRRRGLRAESYWDARHAGIKAYLADCVTCASRGPHRATPAPGGNLHSEGPDVLPVSSDIISTFPTTTNETAAMTAGAA
jgi:hypothetical protein